MQTKNMKRTARRAAHAAELNPRKPKGEKSMKKYINTTWQLYTYDVLGNAKDGYDVNNKFSAGNITLRLHVETANPGKPNEFLYAGPSDSQIRRAFGLTKIQLDTDGDDLTIYVNARRDGYPIGEMHCTSHESLSPIKPNPLVEL